MSERFSRLFSLPENLYTVSAPVVIVAGALLKDNQTGKVLAQLKLKNIGAKAIKAASVSIQPLDTVGNVLGDEIPYQYLDLNANRSGEFGTKTPIALPNASTRSYTVSVTEVIFADNTVWKTGDGSWEALNAPATLEQFLKDQELVKQYRTKFGEDCQYEPSVQDDLWYCTCGEINRKEETRCCRCRNSASAIFSVNLDELKAERDARLVAEQKKAAEERAAADTKAKKAKRTAILIVAAFILIFAVMSILCIIKSNQEEAIRLEEEAIRLEEYNAAVELLNSGKYEEAIEAFAALGDYKDSTAKMQSAKQAQQQEITEEKYQKAVALYNAKQYEAALAIFNEIPEYLDSKDYRYSCMDIIEEIQVKENFAGYFHWEYTELDYGAANSRNNMYKFEWNPYDQFYVDFETKTITMYHTKSKTEKVNSFRVVSSTVLETKSFRCSNGTATVYWHFVDGAVYVSFSREFSGTHKLRVLQGKLIT